MTEPPKPQHKSRITQAELERLYNEHKFDEKLVSCRQQILRDGPRKPEDTFHSGFTEKELGKKFFDPVTGESVAVIFWYTDFAGVVTRTIRMLRIGNIIYDAKQRPQIIRRP